MQGCHLVFNRFEPRGLLSFTCLLVVVPIVLTPVLIPHNHNVPLAVAMTFSTYLSTLVAATLAYRLSPFHPLAKYPGPVMCKISKLWFAGVAMGGKQHIYYQQIHEHYGDIVRIGTSVRLPHIQSPKWPL
jgi:peptidoglycan biosynthesis protein MviN/MurJ (putative lipid II flippase)